MYDDITPKKLNPRQKANIFSQLLFTWIIPKLYKGSKQGLTESDLPNCLTDDDSQQLGDKLERNWEDQLRKPQSSLRLALLKTFWTSAVIDGAICLFYILLKSLIPLILGQLLKRLQNNHSLEIIFTGNTSAHDESRETGVVKKMSDWWFWIWQDVYMLAMLLVGLTCCGCFINHHVDQRQKRMGAKMRIACCSLIQRKATKLSLKTVGEISIGHIVNIISNDVNRLDIGFVFAHYIWILPIQTLIIGWLIWQRLGYAAIIGVVALLLQTIPVQMCLSTWTAKLRRRIAERTDKRISQMNELIRGMQVIKMYVWELCFRNVVKESRRLEIRETRKAAYLRSFYLSSMILPERLTLFITIVAAVQLGQVISADAIFAIANLYHVFQLVAGIFCPMAISFAAEALVSIKRIEEFLRQPEKLTPQQILPSPEMAVEIDNVTGSWDNLAETLKNVYLNVSKGKLCIIAGPVGSGKSSLLQLILGELAPSQGNLKVIDNVSYASQEPWLFTGSIRNNILFTAPYRPQQYRKVVEKCCLLTDFEQLQHQDKTLVGERGTSLSGGQKARINLARAVYKNASLYLFDDPLSAVDAHVGRELFEQVIGPRGILREKTRILVTHQTQYITAEADLIVWLDKGCVRSGNWEEMRHTIETQILTNTTEHKLPEERNLVQLPNEIPQNVPSKDDDPLLNGWQKFDTDNHNDPQNQVIAEEQGQGFVKANVWWAYFHAGNSICGLIYITFVLLISQAICSGADYFVNIYTKIVFMEVRNGESLIDENLCLIIYAVLIGAAIFMIIYRCYLFLKTCMHASKVLHDRMFGCILKATMRFFDCNPSGRILNRFSKDMGAIDESLPRFMSEFTHLALVMLGVLVVICIVNPWLLTAVAAVFIVDFVIIKLYLCSSQDLKRLEGIRRSPVFSHVSATLSGLDTIRSHKKQNVMIQEFDKLQNIHSAAYHLTLTSNTALGLWLDLANVFIMLSSVTFGSIYSNSATYSGNVGLAITQAMMLTGMVQYGLRQLGEAFQQMTSVERILEYTRLKQEKTDGFRPGGNWPQSGLITYDDVNVRYHKGGQLVLKNLSFIVASGWKVGIVGRTGAGKSSLIASLFRLCESIEGCITIDGQDTQHINLEKLRSSISIIPQEPVLFKGSIRYNLDPFEKFQDHELWQALKDVNLSKDLSLDFQVAEYGSNLSIGQRQLICLARALLGRNRILVMDEATANVDQNTDHLIQQTIHNKFSERTVLTVAHRLKTVMNYDRVMVLDNGELKEFGIPYELLQKPNGYLKHMVAASGDEATNLYETAQTTFKKLN